MWRIYRRRRRRRSTITKHYQAHKTAARNYILPKVAHWSAVTGYQYNRVAIRNTTSRWGSCSDLGNLNFSYKLYFLPEPIADYIIVHELCHRVEFNHRPAFWHLVAAVIPEYRERKRELKQIEKLGWTKYLAICSQHERSTISVVPERE